MSDTKHDYDIFDPSLPGHTMLTAHNIVACLNLGSTNTWHEWHRKGLVPKAFLCGPSRQYRWKLADILQWIEDTRK